MKQSNLLQYDNDVLKDGQSSENSSPAEKEPNSVKEPEISVPDQEAPSK